MSLVEGRRLTKLLQIDFDSSQQENRVCIQSGVDAAIDELSELIEGRSIIPL